MPESFRYDASRATVHVRHFRFQMWIDLSEREFMFIARGLKVIGFVSILALVGCASTPPRPPIAIDLGADKTFTFKSVNAEGEKITARDVAGAIERALTKASGFEPVHDIGTRFSQHLDGSQVRVDAYAGLSVTSIPNGFKVAYVKGERADRGYGSEPVPTGATFSYSIEEGEKIITAKVSPPKEIEVAPREIRQLASDEAISADIKRIFNNLNPEVMFWKKKSFKGDVDVKYGIDAVNASFKRAECRKAYPSATTCSINIDGVGVSVEVAPYKEGSKTTYQFEIKYTLNGNGETTYSPALEKKIIAAIEKIVKD